MRQKGEELRGVMEGFNEEERLETLQARQVEEERRGEFMNVRMEGRIGPASFLSTVRHWHFI